MTSMVANLPSLPVRAAWLATAIAWLATAIAGLLLAACDDGADLAGNEPPAQEVVVEVVTSRSFPLELEYPGRVAGFRQVTIRPRVQGILLSREYEEGEIVQQGDVLFRIDPRPYVAGAESANARLAEARANLRNAQQRWERVRALFSRGNVSAAGRDTARAELDLAKAALDEAQADAEAAGLSLAYTTVVAPITGATSTEARSEGSLVGTTADTVPLTTITQLDPVYVNFSPAETEVTSIREQVAAGLLQVPDDGKYAARVISGSSISPDATGIVDFTDNTVNLDTGTIRARAVFDNPDNQLIPGQFVRIAVSGFTLVDALTVPAKSLSQAPEGAYVFVVNDQDMVERRRVEIGRPLPKRWTILSGLSEGDRVITEGVVKVRDGQTVSPVTAGGEVIGSTAQSGGTPGGEGDAQ